MKTKLIILGILFVIFGVVIFRTGEAPVGDIRNTETKNTKTLTIDTSRVIVELARTPSEHQYGLMDRKTLAADRGMLFVFSDVAPRSFWNERTFIPLDILWIRGDVVVGMSELPKISDGQQTVSSPEPVDKVLEVNKGWVMQNNIEIGDKVLYE